MAHLRLHKDMVRRLVVVTVQAVTQADSLPRVAKDHLLVLTHSAPHLTLCVRRLTDGYAGFGTGSRR
jgi:hypothetical protein